MTTQAPAAPAARDSRPAEAAPPLRVTRIRPESGWRFLDLRELWRYRELLLFLAWRDVVVRYKQTALGAAWAVLQPLMMMAVFTIFFSRLAGVPSAGIAYPLFAFAGLLPWTFFATAVAFAGHSVVNSERLVTKVYFPRLAIPLAAVGASAVDAAVAFGMLLVLMLYFGAAPGVGALLLPAVFLAIVLAATGVGTALAALNVAYRDFRYVIPFLLQVWMFATPTVYLQPDPAPGGVVQALLTFNPMTALVETFRACCLNQPIPWGPFGIAALASLVVFLAGCAYFRRAEDGFADII